MIIAKDLIPYANSFYDRVTINKREPKYKYVIQAPVNILQTNKGNYLRNVSEVFKEIFVILLSYDRQSGQMSTNLDSQVLLSRIRLEYINIF